MDVKCILKVRYFEATPTNSSQGRSKQASKFPNDVEGVEETTEHK